MDRESPLKPQFKSFLPAIGWFIISFVLLTLPGDDLPRESWMDDMHIDKFVHVFLFGVLVYLAYLPWKENRNSSFKKMALIIAFLALDYGILMEFVQKYFIPNRSFDVWDIVADGIGCFIPFFWVQKKIKAVAA